MVGFPESMPYLLGSRFCALGSSVNEQSKQHSNFDVVLEWMSQAGVWSEVVLVPAPDPFVCEVVCCLEFSDDSLCRAFRDADLFGNIA